MKGNISRNQDYINCHDLAISHVPKEKPIIVLQGAIFVLVV
jgi:hypothetical protein